MNRQQPDVQELLWVNKTPRSTQLSRSNQAEAAWINRHVQLSRRKAKLTTKKGDQGLRQASDSPQDRPLANRSEVDARRARAGCSKEYQSNLSCFPLDRQSILVAVPGLSRPIEHDGEGDPYQPLLHVPRDICQQGTAMDPFQSSVIHMDHQANILLQYFVERILPPVWERLASVGSMPADQRETASRDLVQQRLSLELPAVSLLACMASRMENVDDTAVESGSSTFIGAAIAALRRHLSGTTKVHMEDIWVIYNIFWAELFRENDWAARTHLQAAKAMVDQLGGLQSLERVDALLFEHLIASDIFIATELSSAPVFSCSWDPGEAALHGFKSFYPELSLANLGSGLLHHKKCQIVSADLYAIIHDTIECVHVVFHKWEDQSTRVKVLKWEFRRKLAIVHRLLSITTLDARAEGLRLALLIWSVLVLDVGADYGIRRTIKVPTPRLKDALTKGRTDDLTWNDHTHILVWILTIGAVALDGEPDQHWFVQQLKTLIGSARIRSAAEFHTILGQSLYVQPQYKAFKKITDRLWTTDKWIVDCTISPTN